MELLRYWYYDRFDWLYTRIYENQFFFFDYWSFVHLWSGFVLFVIIIYYKKSNPFLYQIFFLVIYELGEILFRYLLFKIIEPETFKDQITDIVIGFIGGVVCFYLIVNEKLIIIEIKRKYFDLFTIFFVSITISFLWVGFYGYKYNVSFLNTPGINVTTWILWTIGLILCSFTYKQLKEKLNSRWKSISIVYILYIPLLFLFEYFNYHILMFREISTANRVALIFDVIHGTSALHIYYLTAPIINIFTYDIINKLFWGVVDFRKKIPT